MDSHFQKASRLMENDEQNRCYFTIDTLICKGSHTAFCTFTASIEREEYHA